MAKLTYRQLDAFLGAVRENIKCERDLDKEVDPRDHILKFIEVIGKANKWHLIKPRYIPTITGTLHGARAQLLKRKYEHQNSTRK